ncbi:sensor histidine kinase [Actinocatenispora comari]|uniref:sensor histidine kinase n=1 Tax=Actinocatenispora comari TaxID=2807577 RepID=UPI001CECF0C5|nr:histidine kinase [Actinocatenispora comari]
MAERTGAGALRWAGRVALAGLLAAGLGVQAVAIGTSWGGGYWIFDVAVGAVAGAAAVCRHRNRTVTAAVGLAVAALAVPVALVAGLPREPSPTLALALAVLVAAAVRALPPRRATAVAACGLVLAAGSWSAALLVAPGGTNLVLLDAVGVLAAVAGGLLLRLLDLRRRAAAEQVRRDERLALARELHDVVAHHVTGIVLQTQAARLLTGRPGPDLSSSARPGLASGAGSGPASGAGPGLASGAGAGLGGGAGTGLASGAGPGPAGGDGTGLNSADGVGLASGDGARLDEALARIESAGADALAAMRRVLGLLRDGTGETDPMPVGAAQLRELADRFAAHGPPVRLVLPDPEPAWPVEVASTVYRLVQEALTNVARHAAQPTEVVATVTDAGPYLTVTVTDDGAAVRARRRPGGYGLLGMRERIEALGGTLQAGPRPDAGWSVVATLPVPVGESR